MKINTVLLLHSFCYYCIYLVKFFVGGLAEKAQTGGRIYRLLIITHICVCMNKQEDNVLAEMNNERNYHYQACAKADSRG